MKERKLYTEIPGGKNSFHSAILTSFSFDFHHFENQVLRVLKQKWITSINILVDQRMLDEVLGLSSDCLKTISQSYAVNGIQSLGAFHPKINFFIGDKKLLILFGSGNITSGGHGKNHELFTGFYADTEHLTQLPLILEAWEYLINISKQLEGYSAERIRKVLPDTCALIKKTDFPMHQFHRLNDHLEVALLYNEKMSINQQIIRAIPSESISKITIVCPYYDCDGSSLSLLTTQFPNATIDVYLQRNSGLPPIDIKHNNRIKFYDFNETTRGQKEINGKNEYDRKLHCKMFHFKSNTHEYCLVGSANATQQAIGNIYKRAVNEEFGALYKLPLINFLKEIGITGKKKEITNVSLLLRPSNLLEDTAPSRSKEKLRITSVDLDGYQLKVYLNKLPKISSFNFNTYSLNGEECFRLPINNPTKTILEFRLTNEDLATDPKFCTFTNEKENIISNKQLINILSKLYNTNPSKENRNIRQILSTIEEGVYNEFEIVDFINQLSIEGQERRKVSYGNTDYAKKKEKNDTLLLTYEEVVSQANNVNTVKILNSHSSSRIWQSIEHLFEMKRLSSTEEQMDEEEEAEATIGRERQVKNMMHAIEIKTQRNASEKLTSVKKMVCNYIEELKRLKAKNKYEVGIIDYQQFLLVSYILTSVCHLREYKLPDSTLEDGWKNERHAIYEKLMLDVLTEFAILHQTGKIKSYGSDDKELTAKLEDITQKMLYHVLLNITLITQKQIKYEPTLIEKIHIVVYNLFNKCGVPNERFGDYLENISKLSKVFSLNQVKQMKNDLLNNLINSTEFITTEQHGVCQIIDRNKEYKIRSLFGVYNISTKKVKPFCFIHAK
jgi:hypothetical protein